VRERRGDHERVARSERDRRVVDVRRLKMMTADGLQWARHGQTLCHGRIPQRDKSTVICSF
jgi:hypothetical protein